jgi:tetratricopeptide (TPR) repeat protein/predicted Ser/Thr protein kinase
MGESPPEAASSAEVTAGGSGASTGASAGDSLLRAIVGMGRRSPPVSLVPGQVIAGTYRIERMLGVGGMGVVYLARDQRLGRDVALKLHATDAGARSVERLAREAAAIAQLSHPNVVTVYQIATHDGQPFVAMEYVDGGTARTWLAAEPRRASEILALYLDAGRGLAAAHAAGLVHRDFKPDNVLVGKDGRVRVADFGLVLGDVPVASTDQATRDDGGEPPPPTSVETPLTRTGAVLGTPAYMAPEQHHGGAVGAAADQFAFAVALWEALTRARPFADGSLTDLRASLARSPGPPAQPLPRYVEAALRRALASEPGARWPTMSALLAALARDPARTRRRAIAATALVVALAGGGVALAAREGRPAAAPPCAQAAVGLAPAEQRRAALSIPADQPAMTRLDAWMASWRLARVAACEDTHVRRTQPLARLELRDACLDRARASLEATLGALATAKDPAPLVDGLPLLDECSDPTLLMVSEPLPTDPAARAEIEAIARGIAQVDVDLIAGRPAEGLATITALTPRAEATGRKTLVADGLLALGSAHIANSKLDGVKAMYERAALLAAEAGNPHLEARAWLLLVDLLVARLEEPAAAALVLPSAIGAVTRAGNHERLLADLRGVEGDLASKRGDHAEARRLYEEAIRFHERTRGENSELARMLNRLASINTALDDAPAARAALERAASVLERNYGPRYRHLAVIWTTHGELERRQGNAAAARTLLERALALKEEVNGPTSPTLIPTLTALGEALLALGEHAAAERQVRRALDLTRASLGPDHPKVVAAWAAIARVQVARREFAAAEQTLRDALAIQRRIGDDPPADMLELDLANLMLRGARFDEARAAVARARPIAARSGDDSYAMAKVYEMTGMIEHHDGGRAASRAAFVKALAILEQRRPPGHEEITLLKDRLAGKL